jgi:tol-pal system protein YbgF
MFHVIRRVGRFAPFPLAGLLFILAPGAACAESLDHRVERLERIMQSQGLVEMQTRLDQLQAEVRTLRGDIELQGHNLEQLQQRQRDLYVDIDGRMRQLELGGAPAAGSQAPAGSLPPAALPATATAAPAPAQPAMDTAQEQAAYEEALNILREGRYPQAAEAYRSFLSQYPESVYAGNAQYWLAETYYVTRQFGTALEEFQAVVSKYPGSTKLADAHLKMGYIHYELGEWQAARKELETVIRNNPDSTAARLAEERLQRLSKEGH